MPSPTKGTRVGALGARMRSGSLTLPVRTVSLSYGVSAPVVASRIVAIDPGLQGTGVAGFVDGELSQVLVIELRGNTLRSLPWWDRALEIALRVATFSEWIFRDSRCKDRVVVSEYPQHFGTAGSAMGFKTGDLVKLAHLVGTIQGVLQQRCGGGFLPVEVHAWKGQLPKGVVTERIQKYLTPEVCAAAGITSHAWDAVGIGLWAMGRF